MLERRHDIVRGFVNERSVVAAPAIDPIGRGRTDRPLLPLRYGDDHRGATWFELELGVVWLCAAHSRHRSGTVGDSFPYFRELLDADIVYPTEADYALLEEERARRFIEFAQADAEALLARAEQQPGVETRGVIGRAEEVGVVVVVVETMDELFLAFSAAAFLDPDRGIVLLAVFGPEGSVWTDWRRADALPTRALGPGELCFSIVRG